ncbi:MAG: type III-B CRISPR module RAMP protein Cmr6 [Pyrinomonadaceae bacterium]
MTGRRIALQSIKSDEVPTANPALWLNKFLGEPDTKDADLKRRLVETVAHKASNPDLQTLYRAFFKRWKGTVADYGAKTRNAVVDGRIVVGLGSESVLETSITLHATYGVPVVPGSALKGLARHFASSRVDGWTSNHSNVVFGNHKKAEEAFAGFVTFFDALPVPPEDGKEQFLHADVITVHHADYYMKENVPPADWDDPTPIPFLSATGTYLIALAGPAEWIEPTFKLLELALKDEGIGAKTSSGYGRMHFATSDKAAV